MLALLPPPPPPPKSRQTAAHSPWRFRRISLRRMFIAPWLHSGALRLRAGGDAGTARRRRHICSHGEVNFIYRLPKRREREQEREPVVGGTWGPGPCYEVTRELPLALPLCLLGIAHSSLQKRHQVRRARDRRHIVFDNLAPLAEHSADILVPPHPQTPAQCCFFRSHLLVIYASKSRYTVAAAREHRRVIAPRLRTPVASVTSPLHRTR